MPSERILIVDHEPLMLRLVQDVVAGAGYTALAAVKGEQAVSIAANEQPALVILEAGLLGEMDGFEAARRIREFSDVPLFFLSASAEPEEELRAFALGADDYLAKPFDLRVLLARVRAVLKRCQHRATAPAEIICNNLVINQAARRVTKDGAEVHLTETEYNLLLELARNRNRVLVHETLLTAVWGPEFRSEVAYLRSYIHILRRKLERDPANPTLIVSRPGIGYMLRISQDQTPGG